MSRAVTLWRILEGCGSRREAREQRLAGVVEPSYSAAAELPDDLGRRSGFLARDGALATDMTVVAATVASLTTHPPRDGPRSALEFQRCTRFANGFAAEHQTWFSISSTA